MTPVFKRILRIASCCTPRGWLAKIIQFPLLAPFYHIVTDDEVPHVAHILSHRTIKEFREDLDFFLRCSQPLSLSELLAHVKNDRPVSRDAFFLSFDDGLRETHDIIAPILKEKGVPATFFMNTSALDNAGMLYRHKASLLVDRVRILEGRGRLSDVRAVLAKHGILSTDPALGLLSIRYGSRYVFDEIASSLEVDFEDYLVGRQPYLSTAQVKSLISQGFTVGAHSIDHPFYPELGIEEQLRQTQESIEILTKVFGLNYRVFAFPFGDEGISKAFFSKMQSQNAVDILFASSGYLIDEDYPFAIQRVGMEDQPYAVGDILRLAETKFAMKLLCGRAHTRRVG